MSFNTSIFLYETPVGKQNKHRFSEPPDTSSLKIEHFESG